MCFFIHPKHREMKTAERNIPCYKQGLRSLDQKIFFSRFYIYPYNLGQLNKIVGEWPIHPPTLPVTVIQKGFHSYSNRRYPSQQCLEVVKCIIPKGAHYFYNPEDQEYVSDQIIVQEFID